MLGRFRLAGVNAVFAVVGLAVAASADTGSSAPRGAIPGISCNEEEGIVRVGNFHPSGDNVVAGYQIEEGGSPRGIGPGPQEAIVIENHASEGGSGGGFTCGGDVGTWVRFIARTGPGADTVRTDAGGFQGKYDPVPRPLPARIETLLHGGGGADFLSGRKGRDEIRGGSGRDRLLGGPGPDKLVLGRGREDTGIGGAGNDVIRARDGKRDFVRCRQGVDHAVVDTKDRVSGCEHQDVR